MLWDQKLTDEENLYVLKSFKCLGPPSNNPTLKLPVNQERNYPPSPPKSEFEHLRDQPNYGSVSFFPNRPMTAFNGTPRYPLKRNTAHDAFISACEYYAPAAVTPTKRARENADCGQSPSMHKRTISMSIGETKPQILGKDHKRHSSLSNLQNLNNRDSFFPPQIPETATSFDSFGCNYVPDTTSDTIYFDSTYINTIQAPSYSTFSASSVGFHDGMQSHDLGYLSPSESMKSDHLNSADGVGFCTPPAASLEKFFDDFNDLGNAGASIPNIFDNCDLYDCSKVVHANFYDPLNPFDVVDHEKKSALDQFLDSAIDDDPFTNDEGLSDELSPTKSKSLESRKKATSRFKIKPVTRYYRYWKPILTKKYPSLNAKKINRLIMYQWQKETPKSKQLWE